MTSPIITEAIRVLVDRRDLTRIEAAAAMEAIMSGAATNVQIAAFLTALRMKGETVEELIGFAQVMRQKVVKVPIHTPDVVAQTDLYGRRKRAGRRYVPETIAARGRAAAAAGARIANLEHLVPGDLVVHLEHGIGRYRGMTEITFDGQRLVQQYECPLAQAGELRRVACEGEAAGASSFIGREFRGSLAGGGRGAVAPTL